MFLLDQFSFKGRQQQAAADPNPAMAVTAGAGSGKTLALVGRYLYWLEQGFPLRSLVAITFTEKAAREMRARIRRALAEAGSRTQLPTFLGAGDTLLPSLERAAALAGVRQALDSARIGTIHSLCAEILRSHPAEAGLDPAFIVLEEGAAAALRREALEAALAWAAADAQAAQLFGVFKERELRGLLDELMARRLDLLPWLEEAIGDGRPGTDAPLEQPSDGEFMRRRLQQWSDSLAAYLAIPLAAPAWLDSLAQLAALACSNPEDKLENARRALLAHWESARAGVASRQWDSAFACLAALRSAIDMRGGSKANWPPADLEAARQAMRSLAGCYDQQLKPLVGKSRWALDEQSAVLLPGIRLLLARALHEYERRKDEQQALDFDDLESRAARLLETFESARSHWQAETRAVLVDEFQDTNERQRQIIYALASFSPHAALTGVRVDPGAIFIVGDAKQSIYKFRGADVGVFRRVQADIAAAGGQTIDLDLTFRAHRPLLDCLNALLPPMMGVEDDPARPFAVPFAPLTAYRQQPDPPALPPPFVEFVLGWGADAEEGRAAAASALAARLHALHDERGFDWGQMALLFRASTGFNAYENALEQAGIPFVTVAGRGFYDRPEIRDLLNALAAIADPSDDLALAGLLRSPAFALSDADLYRLRFPSPPSTLAPPPKGEASLPSPIGRGAGGEGGLWPALAASPNPLHQRAQAIITELHALSGRAPAAAVLKRLLDLTAYRAILSAAAEGSRMTRNVDKLLADAHRSRLVSLGDFLAYVQTLRDVGLREGEAPVEAGGAVQLMTVHKSKGLEFPVTALADAAYEHRGRRGKTLLDPALGLLLDVSDDTFHPAAWQLASLAEDERDDAEDCRLLYVAATRAREMLLVSGHTKTKRDGSLELRGWLKRLGEPAGLGMIRLEEDPASPRALELDVPPGSGPIACTISPLAAGIPVAAIFPVSAAPPVVLPDLLPPIAPPAPEPADEKAAAREADPPQRVWRVTPKTRRPAAPAWVVGKLVHEALRRWRFPGEGGAGEPAFDGFLRPFALEAGLADAAEIAAALRQAGRLLARFHAHPLRGEIEAAERYHELPYTLPGERGVIDVLYQSNGQWFVADFKTDEVRSEAEARQVITRQGYDTQVARYAAAVGELLGERPRALLVFLQVGGENSAVGVFPV